MDNQYVSRSQLRGYRTLMALFGNEAGGISATDLGERVGSNKSQVFKDLSTMQAAGIAEQLPDKNWRVTPAFGREAFKILNALDAARQRVDETAHRYGINL